MRVAVVVAAMLFCMAGCSRNEIQKSVAVEPQGSVTNSIGMELIEIPAGKFTMGSPEDEKDRQDIESQVSVTLTKPFGLCKYEVTQGQWKSVMGTEPWDGQDFVQADKDCPATYVSYFDAVEFCDTLTEVEHKAGKLKADEEYRLPTEAEWEYACRAGTTTAFSFGDESKLNAHAWWGGFDLEALIKGEIKAGPGNAAREQYAHTVGKKKPNPWGLHDMHGNVYEWCSDWYDEALLGGIDPVGPVWDSDRVHRSGSWGDFPGNCRSANRGSNAPSIRDIGLGFRVARSQSKMEKPEPVEEDFKSGESVTNSIGMVLIEIPAGTFTMGSPEDEEYHQDDEVQVSVTLTKPFGLGKTEVTQGQWKSVMGTEPWDGQEYVQADKDCPATYVNKFDATKFCQKLTEIERNAGKLKADEEYRLPTEAEWEYACRAGTETAFSFGDDESKFGEHAWFEGNAENAGEYYAHIVGKKKPNPWGLHDMHGNVREWCSDRGLRGGFWGDFPTRCRSAIRYSSVPSDRDYGLGFRVARSQSKMEKPEPVEEDFKSVESVTNSIGMELIEIPAGKFTMGEGVVVAVTLTKPFRLGKYEVTQGEFKKVMGTEPWLNQGGVQIGEDNPATYVNWDDAIEFCKKLTATERNAGKLKAEEEYRLPTEAEWEYACRAGTTTAFFFGDDESQLGEHAWSAVNANDAGENYAHKVGLKKPNPWGLYDMHGNVNEWCSDWNGGKPSGGTDPVGPNGGKSRVIRGGSWRSTPGGCRSASRSRSDPSHRVHGLGFRVARSQSKMEKPEPVEEDFKSGESVTNSIEMELIDIPAGKFTMGSPEDEKDRSDNEAQASVTLTKPFGLGKTEVTQGQWKSVMGTEPWDGEDFVKADNDCPATYVSWDDATEFCKKLTDLERKSEKLKAGEEYRLPTEAEWEYACRAGTTTAFSFGDDEKQLGGYAWFDGNALNVDEQYAHKVGLKKPNPWGLHDMHGNVWEWCSDWYDGKLIGGVDPIGPEGGSFRVFRGGDWGGYPGSCRSANRSSNDPSIRFHYLGFRVARSQSVQ